MIDTAHAVIVDVEATPARMAQDGHKGGKSKRRFFR
jgi:hypothetical protein